MLPNFYTDDQWNELTEDERQLSQRVYECALDLSPDEIEAIFLGIADYSAY